MKARINDERGFFLYLLIVSDLKEEKDQTNRNLRETIKSNGFLLV